MSMMGSDDRMDEVMHLFIQWPLIMLSHYKISHLVPSQGNASLNIQAITLLSFSIQYSQSWPFFFILEAHV